MTQAAAVRERAIALMDRVCPRCGTAREPDQAYCLECGEALPPAAGRLAALRRSWVHRFGWYPGDWIWPLLLLFAVAVAGAAAAIVAGQDRRAGGAQAEIATAGVPVAEPAAPVGTALPTSPKPDRNGPAAKNGRFVWPAGRAGWTIVLVSFPQATGVAAAQATAAQAAKAGLSQVGVLDSSRYPSLQPGYFVVFSGVYPSQTEANAAVGTVHQAGFGGAYSRQIAG